MEQGKKKGGRPRLPNYNDPGLYFQHFQPSPSDSKPPRRGNINWQLVGCYNNLDELAALARANKVSRRKTDELLTGSKITFRCNSWKRTRCPYQMYSLTLPGGKIYVYQGGQHDHNGLRIPHIATIPTPTVSDFADLKLALNQPKLDPEALRQQREAQLAAAAIQQGTSGAAIGEDVKFSQYMNNFPPGFLVGQQEPGSFNISELLNDSPAEPDGHAARECQPAPASSAVVHQQKQITGHGIPTQPLIVPKEEELYNTEEEVDITTVKEEPPSVNEPSSSQNGAAHAAEPFALEDKITYIRKIATEYCLEFTFKHSEVPEFILSNKEKTKTVILRDCGQNVLMDVIRAHHVLHQHKLEKSDWATFEWGLRGFFLHFLSLHVL